MKINFKIFFKKLRDNNENIVLLKGNLLDYEWSSLKEKIIENSHNYYFQSRNLMINENDNFILDIIEIPNIDLKKDDSSIFNEVTFSYILEKVKEYQKINQNEQLKINFSLRKIDNLPKFDMEKYEICLKDSLSQTWKIEKEKIKEQLNKLELNYSKFNFINQNINKSKNNEIYSNIKNNNIVCNNCLTMNFYGYRYTCSYCNNYNLCSKCYKTTNHDKEHNFILFKKPIINKEDIKKYNVKISPSFHLFTDKHKSFDVNFKIVNIGEMDLNNCYIGYIKFDNNYLYCEKYIINEKLEKNNYKDIELKIHFNDYGNIAINEFEGNFRMFTENGVPFGDILKIKVINGNISEIDI